MGIDLEKKDQKTISNEQLKTVSNNVLWQKKVYEVFALQFYQYFREKILIYKKGAPETQFKKTAFKVSGLHF